MALDVHDRHARNLQQQFHRSGEVHCSSFLNSSCALAIAGFLLI